MGVEILHRTPSHTLARIQLPCLFCGCLLFCLFPFPHQLAQLPVHIHHEDELNHYLIGVITRLCTPSLQVASALVGWIAFLCFLGPVAIVRVYHEWWCRVVVPSGAPFLWAHIR